ncbi:hypothetical protein [Sneathiella aquimaris]|uniref:hypothetical protein n=1 Tax=Sneathiella aquimaris TaxID=2599305 RepID=UPI00146DE9DA|nr:hypothetical protein [Sneathiella aquimaris]
MSEEEFTIIVKEAINYNQLNRYFLSKTGKIDTAKDHFDLTPDLESIRADKASDGGLKLSHAQRRMLILLVALWDGRYADDIFNEGIGSLGKMIHSMDRGNRELFADLIVTYPGWGS